MRERRTGIGIFLLFAGILWLLMNFGILSWSILDAAFQLWPLIFVVIGISLIFSNNTIVRTGAWLVFLAAIILYGTFVPGNAGRNTADPNLQSNIAVEKPTETQNGLLKLGLGGANLEIGSTSTNLISGEFSDRDIEHSVKYENGNETAVVEIDKKRVTVINRESISGNCQLSLNDSVLWDMEMKTGAIRGDMDLSGLKVRNLDIDVGAAKLDLTLGSGYPATYVKMDAGASSIDVNVPAESGVKVKLDGALNGTNLGELGWSKQGDWYVSPNYDSASSKIDMDIDMGVGSFKVNVMTNKY